MEKYGLKMFIGSLSDTNYYNPSRRVVRAKIGDAQYDFRLLISTSEVPNPTRHYLILLASEESIESSGIPYDDLKYLPGNDKDGNPTKLPLGGAILTNIQQTYTTTNPQNASAAMNTEKGDMSSLEKVLVSISPPSLRHYTNNNNSTVDSQQTDDNNESFGVFMNDSSVLLKSRGGSITLSNDGIHVGGPVTFEYSQFSKDLMADNQLSSIIPSAFPTCILSMQQLPNFHQFMRVAESARKIIAVTQTASSVASGIGKLAGVLSGTI